MSSRRFFSFFLPACLSSPLHSCLSSFRPFFCPRNLKRPLSSSFVLRQPRLANCKKQGKKKFLGCVSSATKRKRRRRPSLPFFGSRFPPNEEAPPQSRKISLFSRHPCGLSSERSTTHSCGIFRREGALYAISLLPSQPHLMRPVYYSTYYRRDASKDVKLLALVVRDRTGVNFNPLPSPSLLLSSLRQKSVKSR